MRVALYARVSTTRQAQAQTTEQQLRRLREQVTQQGWSLDEEHVYRDDGYSGARLSRPGLDRLRDRAALAALDRVLVTAPDRLARNYVHQVLLIEELERHGCQVEFLDRPMSQDPHDQLLLQIRGAVAEYERTLISERMRRGRLMKLQAGQLLPWTKAPFGYRLDPQRPRDPAALRRDEFAAVVVEQLFAWYLEPAATLYAVTKRLTEAGIPTPQGQPRWNVATVRGMLRNPAYTGTAAANRTQVVPPRKRQSALRPVGTGSSQRERPAEEWIPVPVPAIVTREVFDQVQAKLAHNQQGASRHNTRYDYLLRGLVSCRACRLSSTARTLQPGYHYYLCRGRTDALRAAQGERCRARYVPAGALDELVWQDLCAVLTEPAAITAALERARGGAWLPQELQARQTNVQQALTQIERQDQRLLEAYLAAVVELAEFERVRQELARRRDSLLGQQRQLEAVSRQRLELSEIAAGLDAFCARVREGLARASFPQRRALVELLVDRVIVLDGEVEIHYVIPTSPEGPPTRFCHLRLDYLDPHTLPINRHGSRRLALARRQKPGFLMPPPVEAHHVRLAPAGPALVALPQHPAGKNAGAGPGPQRPFGLLEPPGVGRVGQLPLAADPQHEPPTAFAQLPDQQVTGEAPIHHHDIAAERRGQVRTQVGGRGPHLLLLAHLGVRVLKDEAIQRQRPALPGQRDLQDRPLLLQMGEVHQQRHGPAAPEDAPGLTVEVGVDPLGFPVGAIQPAGQVLPPPFGGERAGELAGQLTQVGRKGKEERLEQTMRGLLGTRPRFGKESAQPSAQCTGGRHGFDLSAPARRRPTLGASGDSAPRSVQTHALPLPSFPFLLCRQSSPHLPMKYPESFWERRGAPKARCGGPGPGRG